MRALPRAPAAPLWRALRALRSADRLAGRTLPGMRRAPNLLFQRALGASLHRRRAASDRGLEGTRIAPPGRGAGRTGRGGRSAAAGKRAHLGAGAARTGAQSRLPSGPVAGARAGADLGVAFRAATSARRTCQAPARSGSERTQPECGRCLYVSARRQPARQRLPDRRRLHQRSHLLGLRRRSAPGWLPPGRGSSPCEGCSRMLEGGRVRANERPSGQAASASNEDQIHIPDANRRHRLQPSVVAHGSDGCKPATSRRLRSA